jgi:RNA polymerase sigma-70 factor (ECF subfamily)
MDERQSGTTELTTWSNMSDEELLLEYRALGDEGVFAQLVHRYEYELFSYLRRYLGDAPHAEDVFQATFLQVHLKCGQFDTDRKFRPWLYSIATNQAIDSQRRNRRHKAVSLDRSNRKANDDQVGTLLEMMENREPGPVAELEASERQAWVRRAVEALPDQYRAPLTLVYYQGLKYQEAAEILGIPVGTAKSRMHTAILKLNEMWGADNPHGTEYGHA